MRLSLLFIVGVLSLTSWLLAESAGVISIEDLAVPETLGKVERRVPGTNSSRWVIHIQDVHAHFTAQENIAAILDHLNAVYGIEVAALEGGWNETSLEQSHALPTSREKQMIARSLLEMDYLTGPAYAALFSQTPIRLIGIEDEALYENNRARFLEHLAVLEDTEQKLQKMKSSLENRMADEFNPDLLTFDGALASYRSGEKAESFLPFLLSSLELHKMDYSDLDQLTLFKQILMTQSQIHSEKLKNEAARLQQLFENKRLTFEELLRSGQIPEEQLSHYPAALQYLSLIELQDQLHYRIFFDQIEVAIGRMKEALIQTAGEKNLSDEVERFRTAEKIILLKATPDDLRQFETQKDATMLDLEKNALLGAFEVALDFYDAAKARDEIFFEKLMNDPRLQGNIAVVTGGFHTDGLSELLENAGISYIVTTPDLAGQEMDHHLYFKRLQEDLSATQTIQTKLKFMIDPGIFDSQFVQAVDLLIRTRDNNQALAVFSESVSPLTKKRPDASITMEQFMDDAITSPEMRVELVREWVRMFLEGDIPIAVTALQNDLLTKDRVWEQFAANRSNSVVAVIPSDAVLDTRLLGTTAKVTRIDATTLKEALQSPQAKRALERFVKNRTAGAITNEFESNGLLVFPPNDLALILARPILEGRLGLSDDPNVLLRFYELVRSIMMTLDIAEEFLKAA